MFDQIRRSARHSVDAERLKAQAAAAGVALADASAQASHTAALLAEQAKEAAGHAKLWAAPRVEAAVDWTTPRVEKAWREGAHAVEPKVERAAEKALPLVETAHDKLVEDLLPKLVAAVNAAAVAAAAGADKARDVTEKKLTDLAHIKVPEPKKSHTGAKVLWLFAGFAAIAAAFTAWRSTRPTNDPWAEQPWESAGEHGSDRFKARAAEAREELGGVVTDVRHDLGDAAEAVGEAAGGAVAHAREASEKVAERAREATEKAREATEKAREATKKASPRRRATSGGTTSDETVEGDAFVGETVVIDPDALDVDRTAVIDTTPLGDTTSEPLPPPGEATPADLDPTSDEQRPGS